MNKKVKYFLFYLYVLVIEDVSFHNKKLFALVKSSQNYYKFFYNRLNNVEYTFLFV